ncbi:MAG TPA: hypothetical protein VFV38_51275 [Ktedonobacteraceae bacterium]|nr:hypothetical protein [Ktedonobacteraceae bacterium]
MGKGRWKRAGVVGTSLAAYFIFSYVTRGKDYKLLDRADIQARLHLPADQHLSSPESVICRTLSDCPVQRLGENGPLVRIIVVTHPAPTKKQKKRQVGLRRLGVVSERFLSNLPQGAFTASDVVSLSLHRGAFETALEDEDIEQEPDRWCGATPPAGRKPGRSWLNGRGTSAWSWDTSWHLSQCAPLHLLLPRLLPLSSPCPPQAMASLWWRPL